MSQPPAANTRPSSLNDHEPHSSKIYDPRAVPEWARASIAEIAQEHPQNLAHHLNHIAQIEAAIRYTAEHPPPPPVAVNPLDLLHLSVIQTWQALASGYPTPDLDPAALQQAIYEAFVTSDGHNQVDQLCEDWLDLARKRGIAVYDQDGDPRPGVLNAITQTVAAAIWFGLTTGYLTLTGGHYHIPRKFLPC